jgi:hypothetical protein
MTTSLIQHCFRIAGLGLICALLLAPAPRGAQAADQPVYAEGLAAGGEDWSWDATVDMASGSAAHGGAVAAATTYTMAWGGLRMHASTALPGSAYSAVHFWVHGGASGGQAIQFKVVTADDQNWDSFATVTSAAGAWTEHTIALAALGSPPTIGDLIWQDASGGAQPVFYVDDVTLIGAQGGGGYAPLAVVSNANIDGFISDQFTWADSAGQPRSAALVKNDRSDPSGHQGGFMRQYTYSLDGSTRVVNGSSTGHPGFGYTVNHYGPDGTSDDMSYLHQGSYTPVLRGRHHAIHQFKWRLNMGGPVDATVQWFFATGRDNPVYAVTFDSSPAGPNVVSADTRAPYGDLQWDGGQGSPVAGVGWGDRYKFRSLASPVTMASGWDYSQPNTVPYVVEHTVSPDAEMGLVQTQTYLQHDAGGYWFYPKWGTSDADGPMPENYNWTYQLNQYELPFTTSSRRMAWGANFGAVGQTAYPAYGDDKTLSGYPYQSYSVFVVLDKHSRGPVAGQVGQVEAVQGTALSATDGSVVTSGPAGIGRPDLVTYAPAGYNQIYGTWNVRADAAGAATFTLNAAQSALTNPIVVIHNYQALLPPSTISVNGIGRSADVGYFASLDAANNQLWLTLKGQFSGPIQISLEASGEPPISTYLPQIIRR